MRPTVLLFDIDGTLITAGGAGRRALIGALAACGAPGGANFPFAGLTDRLIVRQALGNVGHEVSEAAIDEVLATYLRLLADEVARTPDAAYRVFPGVAALLEAVSGRAGVAVGLGTGNVETGARIKLGRVGLSERFSFGGFGCDAEDRAELIGVGAERGAARLGLARRDCRVVVIGDTPRDVAAAHQNGADCVAVATGMCGVAELQACGPRHVFATLADAGCLDAILGQPAKAARA